VAKNCSAELFIVWGSRALCGSQTANCGHARKNSTRHAEGIFFGLSNKYDNFFE